MTWRAVAAAGAVLAVALLLRLPRLGADPTPDVQYHFLTDEGQYAHNARQKALFGAWIMDEHNDALFTAPLHTFLLERAIATRGPGLASARLPGALAGALGCALIVLLLAGRTSLRAACAAGLLAATGTFLVTHARVAFTETLQLAGVTLAVLAAWRARGAPWWGAAAALGAWIALGAKLSSAPLGLVLAAQWVWRAAEVRRGSGSGDAARGFALFAAAGFAGLLAVTALAWPQMDAARDALAGMARLAGAGARPLLDRVLWFGFRDDPGGAHSLRGLFAQEPALVLGAAWLGTAAWLGRRVPGDRFLVVSAWLWAGLLFVATATHPALSPDRRDVLYVPALGLLLALAAFAPAGRDDVPPGRPHPLRILAAGATLALVTGIYLRPLLLRFADLAAAGVRFGAEPGLSHRSVLGAGWILAALLATIVLATPALRRVLRPSAGPARVLLAWALLAGLVHGGAALARPGFTIRDASRTIGARAGTMPPSRRLALGSMAETFALENDLRCLVVRDWGDSGTHTNLDALERLDPPWVIAAYEGRRLVGWSEAFRPAGAVVDRFPVWNDRSGRPRLEIRLARRDAGASEPGRAP